MALTIEQIEIAKKIKELNNQLILIQFELDDLQETYGYADKEEKARILGLCDFLDSEAFCFSSELKSLIRQLNNQGITEQSHPSIFPVKKTKRDVSNTNTDLPDELPW